MWIDGHVNIHSEAFKDDLDQVMKNALDAGVGGFLAICDQLNSSDKIDRIIEKFPKTMGRTIGIHPHYAKHYPDLKAEELVRPAMANHKIWAIGETGLDFHYNFSDENDQSSSFVKHIEASLQMDLPLVIHSRNADKNMIALLDDYFGSNDRDRQNQEGRFLLHCFTSGKDLLKKGLELGGYVSFTGIITFKNAQDVREYVRYVPNDRLLIETDCPYLAPVPHRGRRCEPAYLPDVAQIVARIKGWGLEETKKVVNDNFLRFYKRAEFDWSYMNCDDGDIK